MPSNNALVTTVLGAVLVVAGMVALLGSDRSSPVAASTSMIAQTGVSSNPPTLELSDVSSTVSTPTQLPALPETQLASQSEINQWLSATNADRAKHGAAPVTWSNELATYAQNWANRGQFAHSNCYGNVKAGENLAAGYRTITQAVAGWYGEVKDCIWPGCQSGKGGAAVGHFTAMVWKGVKEIGCGINPTGWNGMPMYVCEYRGTKTLSCDTPNMGGCYNNNVQK
jgi:hypothetical protein